jgi:hypothetical protein
MGKERIKISNTGFVKRRTMKEEVEDRTMCGNSKM